MKIDSLTSIAARQHGVVALHQAALHGIGRRQWHSLCHDGVLVEVFSDVGRLAGATPSALSTVKAATLAVGPDARASHGSAALTWGAECRGVDPVDILVGSRNRHCHLPGIRLHRPRDLADVDAVVRRGVPTTRPLRTLCDLGAVDPGAVPGVLQHFLVSGTVRPDAVAAALGRHRRRGRAGVVALEEALRALVLGAKPPDSLLEVVMGKLFTQHGLPPFEFHARVAGYEVDFLVVGTNVVVETDGWSTHGLDRDQFERDKEKDALLGAAGYIVRRFTWYQVRRRPAWVAAQLRATLERWAPHSLAS